MAEATDTTTRNVLRFERGEPVTTPVRAALSRWTVERERERDDNPHSFECPDCGEDIEALAFHLPCDGGGEEAGVTPDA